MSLCQLRQFRISSALDDGRPLPMSLRRHIDSCPRCREFAEKSGSLVAKLTPVETEIDTPAWLHTKIMAKIRAAEPDTPSAISRGWLPAVAAAACIALAIGLVAHFNNNTGADGPENNIAEADDWGWEEPPIHPAEVTSSLEKHAKQALSREFQNLATDITGARNFLSASIRNTIPGLGDE